MQTIPQPSAYEIDRANRNREARGNVTRMAERQAFSADRDQAIVMGVRAKDLESKRMEYDRPESGMRDEVRSARKWLTGMIIIGTVLILAAAGDLLFGTPDLIEVPANKLASLFIDLKDEAPSADSEAAGEMPKVAPVNIRIVCGVIFSVLALVITLLVKRLASTTEMQLATSQVAPGDDEGYRKIQRGIWLRRAIVVPYTAGVVMFFWLCYTTDLQKARDLVAMSHPEDLASTESTNWDELGLELSGSGELKTNEATPTTGQSEIHTMPADLEEEARMMARPQILIYSLLACAHCLIFLTPLGQRPDDIGLAFFKRNRVEKQAKTLRHNEERIILDLHSRLLDADPEMRDRLVIEAGPIARRMNEILGREAIEVPEMHNAPVSTAYSGPAGESSWSTPESSAPEAFQVTPPTEPQATPRQPENPDDLYKAIFG
jgi:hypothetical protein